MKVRQVPAQSHEVARRSHRGRVATVTTALSIVLSFTSSIAYDRRVRRGCYSPPLAEVCAVYRLSKFYSLCRRQLSKYFDFFFWFSVRTFRGLPLPSLKFTPPSTARSDGILRAQCDLFQSGGTQIWPGSGAQNVHPGLQRHCTFVCLSARSYCRGWSSAVCLSVSTFTLQLDYFVCSVCACLRECVSSGR